METGPLQIERIVEAVRTSRVGWRVQVCETTTSTNDEVLQRINEEDLDGLVIFAEHQSAGRGRMGRTWQSPRGASLLLSVLLIDRPEMVQQSEPPRGRTPLPSPLAKGGKSGVERCTDTERLVRQGGQQQRATSTSLSLPVCDEPRGLPTASGLLVPAAQGRGGTAPRGLDGGELCLLTAVAACDAVKASTDVRPKIKWPNDLVVGGRKLGGILIESRQCYDGRRGYAIGIGINCLQQRVHFAGELAGSATSLEIESAHPVSREALAISLLTELDRWLAEPGSWDQDDLRHEWLARAEPIGGRVCLREGGECYTGTVIDVDPGAGLVVQLDEGGMRAFDVASTTVTGAFPTTSA